MQTFIAICGFVGAWLLVAGPVYQAALELKDEDIEQEHIETVRKNLPTRKHASVWWWLLPPIKLLLEHRLNDTYRQDFLTALPDEDVAAMLSFMSKAVGWLFVSAGGFLLAVKETYELIELVHWNLAFFWIIAAAMAVLCVANTAVRMSRSETIAKQKTGNS